MKRIVLVCAGVLVAGGVVVAEDTTGWRGDGSGEFDTDRAPVSWSSEAGIRWKVALSGWSNASPVVDDDRIYVGLEQTTLLCLSRADGRELWRAEHRYEDAATTTEAQAELKEGRAAMDAILAELTPLDKQIGDTKGKLRKDKENAELKKKLSALEAKAKPLRKRLGPYRKFMLPKSHGVNGYSTPTPVTDGKLVYTAFGNGVVACYTRDGKRLWIRDVGRPQHGWGHSASPALVDGTLVLHYGRKVHGLNAADGEERWAVESDSTWGSPAAAKIGDTALVVTTGGDLLRADTGERVVGGIAKFPWTSPLVEGDRIYVADQDEFCALQLTPEVLTGAKPKKLWTLKPRKDRYYASPVCHDGLLYAITRGGHMTVVDVETGEKVYEQKLEFPKEGRHTVYPSPVRAGELLYVSTDNGSTLVLKPGRTYDAIGGNELEPFRSSPVVAGGDLLIRGQEHLWCIAGK